jgi:hypothetical protein
MRMRQQVRLRERVVVRNARAREGGGHAQVHEQLRRALGAHGAAAVRMQDERIALEAVLQVSPISAWAMPAFSAQRAPSPRRSAEDVDEHVEVKELPLERAPEPVMSQDQTWLVSVV